MEDFLFGVATSAYQIEGAVETDGRGKSIWDTFAATAGNVDRGEDGSIACDHYNRVEEDLDLIQKLGVGAYRFSISWSRILPEGTGEINTKGLDFYHKIIDGLLSRGIEPWVTLFHWDLPQSLQDRGGFANRDIVDWFATYCEIVVKAFGDKVKSYVIVNEPCVFATHGHLKGCHAPGIKDPETYYATVHHINLAMATAYKRLKALAPDKKFGSAFAYTIVEPASNDPKDVHAADVAEAFEHGNHFDPLFNGVYPSISREKISTYVQPGDLESIKGSYDYIGIQHYMPFYARHDDNEPFGVKRDWDAKPLPKTSFGWSIEPEVFYKALMKIKSVYGNPPVYITENGRACFDTIRDSKVDDQDRIQYLTDYMDQMIAAKTDGANIKGYFVWSLLDNFEWAAGYAQRFGIVYVDFDNDRKRTPKSSYYWYADKIKAF